MDIRNRLLLLLLVLGYYSEALLSRSKHQGRSGHAQRPPSVPRDSSPRRPAWLLLSLAKNAENGELRGRRHFLASLPFTVLAPYAVQARGLVQFPCTRPLQNIYHFMRVGTSLLEEDDIWSTNPLFLTNREDALSPQGQEQVIQACEQLRDKYYPTAVRYSLAASCIDTAGLVGRELNLGRDRLIPEYTYLDPRAIGQWDMLSKAETQPAVWAMDADEAGPDGLGARPPPNTDGTPHEVLADQAVRLRQLLSVLESQYSGDTILLIFPDGTGPALLSAMMAGIPYNRVHELEFAPGELRVDITLESTKALWKMKQNDPEFKKILAQGRDNLQKLRDRTDFVNIKDQKMEEERLIMEKQQQEKKEEQRLAEERENKRRLEERENQRRLEELKNQMRLERQRELGNEGMSPVTLSALGAAAVGGAVVLGGKSGGKRTVNVTKTSDSPLPVSAANVTAAAVELPEKVATSPLRSQVNGDMNSTFSVSDDDPYQVAEKAMQDYLNKDDGGDAWLQSIGEIITEDSDDEAFQMKQSEDEAFQ